MTDFEQQELESTEITLGTGKLLGLFVGLVGICAIFFSLGYALGKNSGVAQPQITEAPAMLSPGTPAGSKPGAGANASAQPVAAVTTDCPEGESCAPAAQTSVPVAEPATTTPELAPYTSTPTQPSAKPQLVTAKTTVPVSTPLASSASGNIVVQVTALSKQRDAEILVMSLRQKGYPAFLASSSDSLFHVQVGPFGDIKEAAAAKERLAADGYHAFLKR